MLRELPDGMDFLLRPVQAGLTPYSSLKDKSITLEDIWIMNTFLDNQAENRRAIREFYGDSN